MVHDCFSCSLLIWGSPLFQATSFSVVNICPGPKLQVGLGWVGLFALFFCLVFVQTLTLSDTPHSKISTYNGLNCCLQEDLDTGKKGHSVFKKNVYILNTVPSQCSWSPLHPFYDNAVLHCSRDVQKWKCPVLKWLRDIRIVDNWDVQKRMGNSNKTGPNDKAPKLGTARSSKSFLSDLPPKDGIRWDLNICLVNLRKCVNKRPGGGLANLGNSCLMTKTQEAQTDLVEYALTEKGET